MRNALVLVPILMLGGCHVAFGHEAGPRETRSFPAGGFEKIDLAGSADVVVQVGGAPSVRAEGSKAALDRLEIRADGGTLHIGQRKREWSFGWHHDGPLRIYVTAPALSGTAIAGSGDIRVDKVRGARFEGRIAGSGDLTLDHIDVGEASFSVAGSGDVRVSGKAGKASFSTAGSGDMHASGLDAGTVSVSVTGSGDVQARASRSADISVMGSGDVQIAGTKNCNVHKAGSGSATCG